MMLKIQHVFLGRLLLALKKSLFYFSRCLVMSFRLHACMHLTAFSIDQQPISSMTFCDMHAHVSIRRCFKSLTTVSFQQQQQSHFSRSYFKANKVSNSEGTMKVEYAYRF